MASVDVTRFIASEDQGGGSHLPTYAPTNPYYNELMAIWPDLYNQKVIVAPAGNGVNMFTGQMLTGWHHVEQSIEILFATPFHERILRRWAGSFVPHLLGEEIVPRIVTRHYWAMGTAIEHWEPRYKIKEILFMGSALNVLNPPVQFAPDEMIRVGHIYVRPVGVYYPRGHLGDFTPYQRRSYGIAGRGGDTFDRGPAIGAP